ncbi:MAG: hypothetical protein HZB38_12595 [Planctomycetes bacterium]|nr:hypothetical protein [Planctomycetota bacterium]
MTLRRDLHHETAREGRKRDFTFQQISAEILREVVDLQTLQVASRRAMNHPEVRADAHLEAEVRGYLTQLEYEIRGRMSRQQSEELHPRVEAEIGWKPVQTAETKAPTPAREFVLAGFERLRRVYDERLLHFDLDAARRLLGQLDQYQEANRSVVTPAMLERCRLDMARTEQRAAQYRLEVDALARAAAQGARAGRMDEAAKALKRLSSIHASHPHLLSESRLNEIRSMIEDSSDHYDHREASRALVQRERSVAEELRKLADAVHAFHRVSHEIPHGDPRFGDAEKQYYDAVRSIRHHDKEWLADLMLELDDLVTELHDESGRSGAQVARFLHSVKAAIAGVVKEIRQVAAESSPAAGADPTSKQP